MGMIRNAAMRLLDTTPAPPFTVRSAHPDDAPAYAACHVACLVQTYETLQPDSFREAYLEAADGWVVEGRRRDLADPAYRHVVATDARSDIVGIAAACPAGHDGWDHRQPPLPADVTGQLDHLYTLSGTHGSGIGRELAERALEGENAYLWVLLGNPRAQAFYDKVGLVPDGACMPCGDLWHFRMMERRVRRI